VIRTTTRARLAPISPRLLGLAATLAIAVHDLPARADESLLDYLVGVETQPRGSWEVNQWATRRDGKGTGHYRATDYRTELEYGFTDRFAGALYVNAQGMDTRNIRVDAYIPRDVGYDLAFSGISASLKYNFLSPYTNPVGLSLYVEPTIGTRDPHSGLDKRTYSLETMLLLQKNFREDTLIWLANVGLESAYARRAELEDLPPDFEWPSVPEMEISPAFGTGVTYRVASNWYIGAETLYEVEYETEVGRERWSWFAGPTLHYGARKWWATLTWLSQIRGGGEMVPGQDASDMHLVEKTENEWRLKIGLNF
jgi:hypothetical protein